MDYLERFKLRADVIRANLNSKMSEIRADAVMRAVRAESKEEVEKISAKCVEDMEEVMRLSLVELSQARDLTIAEAAAELVEGEVALSPKVDA